MTITWRRYYLIMITTLLLVVSLMVSCTSFIKALGGDTSPSPAIPDNGAFKYALSIYQRGDYTQAERLFNVISKSNTNGDQHLKARLGEICCRLVLAESPEALSTAKGMWKNLKHSHNSDIWQEGQVLLDPLIDRLSVSAEKPSPPKVSAPVPPKKQKETDQTALKKKAAQVTRLQRQLDAVMAENQTLKQKIKALEAIDQNIQKKKTEISAPSD